MTDARTTTAENGALPASAATQSVLALDVHAAARALCISERTLHTLTRQGKIPHVQVGWRILYRPEALQEFLRQGETTAPQPARKREGAAI